MECSGYHTRVNSGHHAGINSSYHTEIYTGFTESTLKVMDCCKRLVYCGSNSTAQGTLLQTSGNIIFATYFLYDTHYLFPYDDHYLFP